LPRYELKAPSLSLFGKALEGLITGDVTGWVAGLTDVVAAFKGGARIRTAGLQGVRLRWNSSDAGCGSILLVLYSLLLSL